MSLTKPGKHLTAYVIANADGEVLSTFFVFAGEETMDRWFDSLSAESFRNQIGVPYWLTKNDWYSGSASQWGTGNGSMPMEFIAYFVSHIQRNFKRRPPPHHKYSSF